jgi:RNA polymerase sigma-70 factor (ECF subfamily)
MRNSDMQQELVQLGNGAHALATHMLGSRDDAADAVHDAYAIALNRPAAFDSSKGTLKTWFLCVVRNRCIDQMRRRRQNESLLDNLVDPGARPEQVLETAQRDQALGLALAQLGSEQRQVLVLRDYMDLSYAEIAAVLEIAPGTVMSRLHRARMALKEELNRHGE